MVTSKKEVNKMPQIGDRVTITITGPNEISGTTTSTGSTAIPAGATISIPGEIIADLGNKWLVELDSDQPLGTKRLAISK